MNVIASADLWFPGHPLGVPNLNDPAWQSRNPPRLDPLRYVVWIKPGRWYQTQRGYPHLGASSHAELAPRTALHLVECRNGAQL